MERESGAFYARAAAQTTDAPIRRLPGDLTQAETSPEREADPQPASLYANPNRPRPHMGARQTDPRLEGLARR